VFRPIREPDACVVDLSVVSERVVHPG
jgi:hypothetical protein